MHASFTGLDDGDVLLCTPIPNTTLIAVYRIKPDNSFVLEQLERDPFAVEAAEQAKLTSAGRPTRGDRQLGVACLTLGWVDPRR
jgi:hypothetical protein